MSQRTTDLPAAPPPEWTYWVVPQRFLAGCFPGASDAVEHRERLRLLLEVGVRVFINLMEPEERNHSGTLFRDYTADVQKIAHGLGVSVRCERFPIRDLGVPAVPEMETLLNEIDEALNEGPIYIHCWGGVGRTGTVAACWLLKHRRATGANVMRVLQRLRQMDRQRGDRRSPETAIQRRFVAAWVHRVRSPGIG